MKQFNPTSRLVVLFLMILAMLCIPGVTALPASAQTIAFVTNLNDGTISIIDTATDSIVGTIPAGQTPFAAAFTPNGRFAYVVSETGDSVSVISTATKTIVGNPIPVGLTPVTLAFTPNGRHAYVTISTTAPSQ